MTFKKRNLTHGHFTQNKIGHCRAGENRGKLMKTATINLLNLHAASFCAGKEETGPYLKGVHVEIAAREVRYIATDGHRLIVIRDALRNSDIDNTLIGAWTIPMEHCKAFKLGRGAAINAVLTGETGTLNLKLSYYETARVFSPIDRYFPNWRRIIPQPALTEKEAKARAEGANSINFNPDYLADFKKVAKILDLTDSQGRGLNPHIVPNGSNFAAFVWLGDDQSAFGLIMPCSSRDMRNRQAPAWANERPHIVEPDGN